MKSSLTPAITLVICTVTLCATSLVVYGLVERRLTRIEEGLSRIEKVQATTEELRLRDSHGLEDRIGDLERTVSDGRKSSQDGLARGLRQLDRRFSDSLASVQGRLSDVAGILDDVARPDPLLLPGNDDTMSATGYGVSGDTAMAAEILKEADSLFASGSYAEANKKYSILLARDPRNATWMMAAAICQYRANPADSRQYQAIERSLVAALAKAGDKAPALEVLGKIEMEKGEWAAAANYFRRMIALDNGDVAAWKQAIACLLYAGDPSSANQCLEQALAIVPGDAELASLASQVKDALAREAKP